MELDFCGWCEKKIHFSRTNALTCPQQEFCIYIRYIKLACKFQSKSKANVRPTHPQGTP